MEVTDLIRTDYQVVNAEDTLSKLFPIMDKLGKDRAQAVLVEEDGKIIGVVREKDLLRGRALKNPSETKVRSLLVKTGIVPLSELSAEKVARRFTEDATPFVIVSGKGKEIGVIYINDFILLIKDSFKGLKAKDVMSKEFYTVKRFDRVAKALSVMKKNGVDRVVVVDENNKAIGMLTGKDVIDRILSPRKRARFGDTSGEKESSLAIMVESVMSSPPITAKATDSVSETIDMMAENRISSVIVEKDGIPEGLVMKRDLLEYYLKLQKKMELSVQISTQGIDEAEINKEELLKDVENFMRKFGDFLGESHVFIYIQKHRKTYKGLPLVSAKIKLWSSKGLFVARGESWGAEYALHVALENLERDVQREKELAEERLEKIAYEFWQI